MIALLAGAALAALDGGGATHDGRVVGETMVWRSEVLGQPGTFPLVAPLPAGTEILRTSAGVTVREVDGQILGFRSDHGQWWVEVGQPVALGEVTLAAPILDGEGTQRITIAGAKFVPDPALGLEPHVGRWTQAGIGHADRRKIERAFGRHRGLELWVDADPRLAGGLRGELVKAGASPAAVAGAAAIFAGLLGLMAAGIKGLERTVRRERTDWYIRHELAPREP